LTRPAVAVVAHTVMNIVIKPSPAIGTLSGLFYREFTMPSPRSLLILIFATLALTACARNPVVQLYDGPKKPDTQVLTVRVPTQMEVVTINGQEVKGANTFFNTSHKDLKLTPGTYEIVAYYKELWDLNSESHEVMKSDPVVFPVNGKAGQYYAMNYKQPENAREARELANNFSGWVENTATGEKTPTQPSGLVLKRSILAPLTGTEVESSTSEAVAPKPAAVIAPKEAASAPAPAPSSSAAPAAAPAGSYVDTLKAQWNQATPEERREFLQWISK
jgi:uncharacterized protein